MLNSYYIKCWFFLVVIIDYRCVTHCGSSIVIVVDFDCSVLPIVGHPATIK